MPIKVLLADDSEIVRGAINRLLTEQSEIELVGEAADFTQTVQMANDLQPQVIVMDLHMPGYLRDGSCNIKADLNHRSRLLAISVFNDEEAKALAESFGAVALLDKMNLPSELIPTIVRLVSPDASPPVE